MSIEDMAALIEREVRKVTLDLSAKITQDLSEKIDSAVRGLSSELAAERHASKESNSELSKGMADLRQEVHEQVGTVDKRVSALSSDLGTLSSKMTNDMKSLTEEMAKMQRTLTAMDSDVNLLRARVSDMDSLQRSVYRSAAYIVEPMARDAVPRGAKFRESESDFRPRSPFAQ